MKAEKLDQVEDKLNNAIQQISLQREKYQFDLGSLNDKNVELTKKLETLIAERQASFRRQMNECLTHRFQELLRTTEEKEKSLRTLERQQFETEKKLRSVEGQLTAEVRKTKKAIEREFYRFMASVFCGLILNH